MQVLLRSLDNIQCCLTLFLHKLLSNLTILRAFSTKMSKSHCCSQKPIQLLSNLVYTSISQVLFTKPYSSNPDLSYPQLFILNQDRAPVLAPYFYLSVPITLLTKDSSVWPSPRGKQTVWANTGCSHGLADLM